MQQRTGSERLWHHILTSRVPPLQASEVGWVLTIAEQLKVDPGVTGKAKTAKAKAVLERLRIACMNATRQPILDQADGCFFLYHVHAAAGHDPQDRSVLAKALLCGLDEEMGGAILEDIQAGAKAMRAWVRENAQSADTPPADLLRRLSKRHQTMLLALWQNDRMKWNDFRRAGWLDKDAGVPEATARAELNRMREWLRHEGFPSLVDHKGGWVWVSKQKADGKKK